MPVFFYIDPEFVEDPKMAKYDEIILSYVFFESKDNESPIPRPHGVSWNDSDTTNQTGSIKKSNNDASFRTYNNGGNVCCMSSPSTTADNNTLIYWLFVESE